MIPIKKFVAHTLSNRPEKKGLEHLYGVIKTGSSCNYIRKIYLHSGIKNYQIRQLISIKGLEKPKCVNIQEEKIKLTK